MTQTKAYGVMRGGHSRSAHLAILAMLCVAALSITCLTAAVDADDSSTPARQIYPPGDAAQTTYENHSFKDGNFYYKILSEPSGENGKVRVISVAKENPNLDIFNDGVVQYGDKNYDITENRGTRNR